MNEEFDADINDKAKNAVQELKTRMQGEMESDMFEDINIFYRFLKARNFNIGNAEKMLRKHLEWRKKINLKNIVIPEVIEKYIPYNFIGYDKKGCVVRYVPIGTIDSCGIFRSIKYEDTDKIIAYFIEDDEIKLKEQSKKLKRNVDKCIYICNMEHFTLRQITDARVIQASIRSFSCYANNYPERLKAVYFFNGSSFVPMFYNLLKKFTDASIVKKIHFYSDDSWKQDILKEVDAEVLPAFLGGTRTDPDGNPLCLTFINHGEPVPQKYFLKSKIPSAIERGLKKIIISAASFHEVILDVNNPGSHLHWEFEISTLDIGFGLFYTSTNAGEKELIELIPVQRINTEEYPQLGRYLCETTGKYVFLLDNTYSWIRSKTVFYKVVILTPEEACLTD